MDLKMTIETITKLVILSKISGLINTYQNLFWNSFCNLSFCIPSTCVATNLVFLQFVLTPALVSFSFSFPIALLSG